MIKFISYTKPSGDKTNWRSAQAVSMGGVEWTAEKLTLFAPRLPPLEIAHPNPEVLQVLAAVVVSFLTNPGEPGPGRVDYGLNVNAAIAYIEHELAKSGVDNPS